MFHRYEVAVNDSTGVPIAGVEVRLYDASDNLVTIYSDNAGTPIINVSGIADTAVSDDAGNYSYYVPNGVYTERLYIGDALAYSIPDVVMQGLVTTIQTPTFAGAATIATSSDTNLVIVSGTSAVGDSGTGRQFAYDATVDAAYVAANPTTSFVDATGRGFKEIPGADAASIAAELALKVATADLAATAPSKGIDMVGGLRAELDATQDALDADQASITDLQGDVTALGNAARSLAFPQGREWNLDFSTGVYSYGLALSSMGLTDFARSTTGIAIGGAATDTFAVNVPRILDGKLFLDAGGTNPLTSPADATNAAWTKTNLDNASATSVAGEESATSAKRIPETVTNGGHSIGQNPTIPSSTVCTLCAIFGADGRDYASLILSNGSTTNAVRLFCNLTGNGSVVPLYPLCTGTGGTSPKGGIRKLGSGLFLAWVSYDMGAANTVVRVSLGLMTSATVSSYAGDTGKALIVEKVWVLPGVSSPASYVATTRAAETLTVPMAYGAHLTRTVDELGETLDMFIGDTWTVTPQTNAFEITSASSYLVNIYDDFTRADTAAGSLGTAQDGGAYNLLKYPGSYPMIPSPASDGAKVASNEVKANAGVTYYAARAVPEGQKVRHMRGTVRWYGAQAGTGTLTNSTGALAGVGSSLDELIKTLPVHPAITRTGVNLTKRLDGGTFDPLGQILISGNPLSNAGTTDYDISWNLHGDILTLNFAGFSICLQDSEIEDRMGNLGFFEKTESSPNTSDEIRWRAFGMEAYPVGEPGDPTPAAPVNFALPAAVGTTAVGSTFSVANFLGNWTSNDGTITFTYQWKKNGSDISGATGSSLSTASGFVATDTVSCALTATNGTGSTTVTTAAVTLT